MRKIWWHDFTEADFQNLDPEKTIAVLPLAATEQHGPHLPATTDADIMDGLLNQSFDQLSQALDIRVFPVVRIGASDEHSRFAATQSISSAELVKQVIDMGKKAHAKGIKKLILLNSHGGNEAAMTIAALELRKTLDMMVVKTSWGRFGLPSGLFSEQEKKLGIHGGDYETSLMLVFKPEAVDMDKARDFASATQRARQTFKHLAPQSPHGFAWLAGDLNPNGVVGDASAATLEKGQLTAAHQTQGFLELVAEVTAAKLDEWIIA